MIFSPLLLKMATDSFTMKSNFPKLISLLFSSMKISRLFLKISLHVTDLRTIYIILGEKCLILTGSDQFSFAPETHYLGLRGCTTHAVSHENLLFLSCIVRDSTSFILKHTLLKS